MIGEIVQVTSGEATNMDWRHNQESEYRRSRQPGRGLAGAEADHERSITPSQDGMLLGMPGLMQCAGIGASCNAHVRAEGMRQMQQTHGNRAVQRSMGILAVQRTPYEDSLDEWARDEAIREAQLVIADSEPITSSVDDPALVGPVVENQGGTEQSDAPWQPTPAPYQASSDSEEASKARKARTTASAVS